MTNDQTVTQAGERCPHCGSGSIFWDARHRTAHSGEGRDFQSEVGDWMLACFGEETAADKIERADRFIEEALELAQTIPGFTVERARALVEYVFARPVGERGQEVGGVGVTLAALCNTYDLNIAAEWERELARVWTKVEAIRAKQATKPTGSALPIPVSGEGRSNDDSPVALLHENAAEGEMEVELYRHGAACLTDADMAAGWTETPLYAHPPCEGRSNGAGEAAVERVAQWLHDEGGFGDSWTAHTWPEHPNDTGQREGGWVKIVPSDVQAQFRDVARRLLTQTSAATLSAPQGEVERMREALGDQIADAVEGRIATEFKGFWAREGLVDEIPGMIREAARAALAQPEAGGER